MTGEQYDSKLERKAGGVAERLKAAVLKMRGRNRAEISQSLTRVLAGAIWHDLGGVGTKLGNDLGNSY
jgi:hypothetical protein